MAKGLNMKLNFQLDTGQAQQQLRDFSRQINEITRAQGSSMSLGINAELKESVRTAQLLKESLASATNAATGAFDLSKFNASINQTIGGIDKVKSALTSLGPSGEKAFNSLSMQIAQASVPMKQTSGMLTELKNSFANSFRWSLTSGAIRKVTSEVQKAFSYAQNLDKSLTNIQIVTGHGADYMKNFATQANAAAKALSASTLEYTNAALIYYQQGLGDKEVAKRAETTVKMAKVTGQTASTISQQMTSVWNNFSNGLDNLERYADVMTALGASTASSSAEIAKGLEKFSSVTKTIGLSYDYAASALATVTAQTRQSADSVGTSFKTLFSRLESLKLGDTLDDGVSLNKYSQALSTVGVNVLDVNGQLRSMDTILDDLAGRWEHLSNAQQVALAQTVGGVRNYTSLITLMSNWDQFQTNLTTAKLSEGTLQKQADIWAKSWEAAQQRVTTSTQTLYQSLISSDFFKGLNNLTSGLLDNIGKVTQVLGSSGTFSGLSMLTNMMFGDRFAAGLNGLENNLMMNTAAGRNWYKAQQMELLGVTKADWDSSGVAKTYRAQVIDNMTKFSEEGANAIQAATPPWYKRIFGVRGPSEEQKAAMQYSSNVYRAYGTEILHNLTDADTAEKALATMMSNAAIRAVSENANGLTYSEALSGTNAIGQKSSYFGAKNVVIDSVREILGDLSAKSLGNGQYQEGAVERANARLQGIATTFTANATKYGGNDINGEADFINKVAGYGKEGGIDVTKEGTLEELAKIAGTEKYEGKTEVEKAGAASGAAAQTAGQQVAFMGKPGAYSKEDLEKGQKGQNFGQFTMGMAQAINATNMFSKSFESFTKSLADGNANMSAFTSTLGSGLLMAGMWGNQLSDKNGLLGPIAHSQFGLGLGKVVGGIGGKLGLKGLTAEGGILTAAGGATAMIGLMAALKTIELTAQVIKTHSMDARVERANEDRLQATAQAKEAKQKYDNFLTAATTQNEAVNKLTELQKGTTAYTTQLIDSNNQARELIDTYDLQAGRDYSINQTNGSILMTAKQVQDTNDRLLQESLEASTRAQMATSKFNQLTYFQQLRNIDTELSQIDMTLHPEGYETPIYYDVDTSQKHIEDLQKEKESIQLQAQADYQAAVSSYISSKQNVTAQQKLAADILMANSEIYAADYNKQLTAAGAWGGETHRHTGGYRSIGKLRAKYKEKLGVEPSADLTQAELAAAIEAAIAEEKIEEQFDEVFKLAENLDPGIFNKFSNYADLSNEQLNKFVNDESVKNGMDKNAREAYSKLIEAVLKNRANSIEDLSNSLLFSSDFEGEDINQKVQSLLANNNLSLSDLDTLSSLVTNFGTNFGKKTGSAVYDILTQTGGLNSSVLQYLQTHTFENNISGLATITRDFQLQGGKNSLRNPLEKLRNAILEDVDSRGSLAKDLFESSEFQDTFESLRNTYWETGNITSQNIADLAEKNQILADYLTVTNNNTQAVATMAELIASGSISTGELTTPIVKAIAEMSGVASAQQAGVNTVGNQNLSDSISSIDKYFQNVGKAYYNAVQNDIMADRPALEGLESILTPDDYAKYQQLLAWGAGRDTQAMTERLKSEMPNVYELLETLGGKKGKGGGGATDAFAYLQKEGVFEGSGITIDEETGRINFSEDFVSGYDQMFGEGAQVTSKNLTEYFIKTLTDKGFSQEYAENYANQMIGRLAASSFSSVLARGDTISAADELIASLNSEDEKERAKFLTTEQINALYQSNKAGFASLKIENGKLVPMTPEEIASGKKGVSPEDWERYVTGQMGNALLINANASDISTSAAAGVETLGDLLAKGDKKIKGTGMDALLEAAQLAGVNITGNTIDFEQLKDFYTNILGISEEDFLRHANDLKTNGNKVFSSSYKDVYGFTHTMDSSGYTSMEDYQRDLTNEEKTRNEIEERRRANFIEKAMAEHPEWTTQQIMDELSKQEEVWRREAWDASDKTEVMPDFSTDNEKGQDYAAKQQILNGKYGWYFQQNPDVLEGLIEQNKEYLDGEENYIGLLKLLNNTDLDNIVGTNRATLLEQFNKEAQDILSSQYDLTMFSDQYKELQDILGVKRGSGAYTLYNALLNNPSIAGLTDVDAIIARLTEEKENTEKRNTLKEKYNYSDYEIDELMATGDYADYDSLIAYAEEERQQAVEDAIEYAKEHGEASDADIEQFLQENTDTTANEIRSWANGLYNAHQQLLETIMGEDYNWTQDEIDEYFRNGGTYEDLISEGNRRNEEKAYIDNVINSVKELYNWGDQQINAWLEANDNNYDGLLKYAKQAEKTKNQVIKNYGWTEEEVQRWLEENNYDYDALNEIAKTQYEEKEAARIGDLQKNLQGKSYRELEKFLDSEEYNALSPEDQRMVNDYYLYRSNGMQIKPDWVDDTLEAQREEVEQYYQTLKENAKDVSAYWTSLGESSGEYFIPPDLKTAAMKRLAKENGVNYDDWMQSGLILGDFQDWQGNASNLSLEEYKDWKDRGGNLTSEQYKDWQNRGSNLTSEQFENYLKTMETMAAAGGTDYFSPDQFQDWLTNSFGKVLLSEYDDWKLSGLTADEYRDWQDNNFNLTADEYRNWKESGIENVDDWRAIWEDTIGMTPGDYHAIARERMVYDSEAAAFYSSADKKSLINAAYDQAVTKGIDTLSPFQRQLLSTIGEIQETEEGLYEFTVDNAEGETAAERARNRKTVDEEGNPVDENGQPIDMPYKETTSGGQGQTTGSGSKKKAEFMSVGEDGTRLYKMPDGSVKGVNDKGEVIDYSGDLEKLEGNGKAHGQNNHLLAFAKGNQGEIAVTGELGPELRIKEDGTADLLGKKGREYAWVNPGDRIYTANQTASILGSNNIPILQGLAKGIRNHIPGYDGAKDIVNYQYGGDESKKSGSGSSGSGSGGSKKDPRYDPNTLKIRDVLERYYTILQKIEDITRAVERFSKVADRAWGKDRIKAIEKQTDLLKQQYDAQKAYVTQIASYYNTDKSALTTMITEFVNEYNKGKEDKDKLSWAGAQFDDNGVLTNYKEFVETLVNEYNKKAEQNAANKEAQYKFQQQLTDIQKYTETLQLWKTESDKLEDLAHQILDNSLKTITYRVEYELELNNDARALLDFKDKLIKDDPFQIAEQIANLDQSISIAADSLAKTREGIYDYLGKLAGDDMRLGPEHTMQELGIMNADGSINKNADVNKASKTLDKWIKELKGKGDRGKEAAEEIENIVKRENGVITNYQEVLEKLNEMNSKLTDKARQDFIEHTQEFFDQLSDVSNVNWEGLTDEQKTQLTTWRDQSVQLLQQGLNDYKEIIDTFGSSIKTFGKQIDGEIDKFSYFEDVYKHFGNIIDLTNQSMTDVTSDFFKTLNSKMVDNSINKIKAMKDNYDLMSQSLSQVNEEYQKAIARRDAAVGEDRTYYQQQVDLLKEQLDTVNEQMETAHKDYLQSWEDALSKISEAYKDTIEKASKDFERGMSPLFSTLALLQAQFDREKALQELYVEDYQRVHDLSRLNRDIENSILDTDNLKGKQRLRDLQKEINKLQEDGTELSEYDLDILDKKYKLELARQALEDAKDAKSLVRLSRDNNGNWSYVYTSNEEDVAEAEQNYEDAIRDMEEANEEYIKNIQDQMLQVQAEAQQAISNLSPEDFATYDEYLAAVQAIQNQMFETLGYLRNQANNVFGNNGWLEGYVPGIINRDNLTDNFGKTTLAKLLGNDNLDEAIENSKDNFLNNLVLPAIVAYEAWRDAQKEAYDAAEYNMETIGKTFNEEMEDLNEQSDKQVEVVDELTDRIGTEYTKAVENASAAIDNWIDENRTLINQMYDLIEAINKLKELDGEQTEPEVYRSPNEITSLADVEKFQTALYTAGRLKLITTDKNGKEQAQIVTRGSNAEKAVYESAMKQNIINLSDPITEAENQTVRARIEQYGIAYVKYKDKEYSFNSLSTWNEFYNQHKKQDAPVATNNGGYGSGGSRGVKWTNPYTGKTEYAANEQAAKNKAYEIILRNDKDYSLMNELNIRSALTGMYTGEWSGGSIGRNGRLAFLHQKELVLNAHDTENFLDAMQIVRQLDNLTNWMANGLGDLIMPKVSAGTDTLEQDVTIHAEFPNVTNHNEIEQAFDNLVNKASQYANRKVG